MALREEGYWDQHYELEIKNYELDGDEGEVWFGEGLSRRIVVWLIKHSSSTPTTTTKPNAISQDEGDQGSVRKVLDIGCGNAFIISTLAEKFSNLEKQSIDQLQLLGIDYSINSISLSHKIIENKGLLSGKGIEIVLRQCDFLKTEQLKAVSGGDKFDYIIDKGTFDAICLLASNSNQLLEETKLKYMESVHSLVKLGSIFILASCNHTEEELKPLFDLKCQSKKYEVKLIDKIETPKLQFGGKEGSQVTCLIFEFLSQ